VTPPAAHGPDFTDASVEQGDTTFREAGPAWQSTVAAVSGILQHDSEWDKRFGAAATGPAGLHLAVCLEPFLGYILSGRKTIESRFGIKRSAPYGRVQRGDVVLLKQTGGPVVGVCELGEIWFYHIQRADQLHDIRTEFSMALCATEPEFWLQRRTAEFVTLMRVVRVQPIRPVPFAKRDQRGWVVLKPSGQPPLLTA